MAKTKIEKSFDFILNEGKKESERKSAEYKALSNEQKKELFEESIRNLERRTVKVRAEITDFGFVCNKNGEPVRNAKNRVQFDAVDIKMTWYPDDASKPQVFTKHYETSSSGCVLSLLINTLAPASQRRDFWDATASLEAVTKMIEIFNTHKNEDAIDLDIYCIPATNNVKKSRLEFLS